MKKAFVVQEVNGEVIPFLNTKICSSRHLLDISMNYEIDREVRPGKVAFLFSYTDPLDANVRKTLNKFWRDVKTKFGITWEFIS